MTGAIDQMGHVLAVGAVNEKIEGFFDACSDLRDDRTHGVIIPRSNAGDLMLRDDVLDACTEGRFAVYAVDTVYEAIHLLTGVAPGVRGATGRYPANTLFAIAVKRARAFWQRAAAPTTTRRKPRA
jgi:ATP-dependent Lon protease